MKIETVKLWAETLCLATIERECKGDNIIDKHFGYTENELISDSDLINRCSGKNGLGVEREGNKNTASAFIISRTDAMETIRSVLMDEYTMKTICKWSNDWARGEDLILEFDFDEVIGKAFTQATWHEWNAGAAHCSSIRIILGKDEWTEKYHPERNFYIKSLYPFMNEEDMEEIQNRSIAYNASLKFEVA